MADATSANLQALIDQRQQELKTQLELQLGTINEFVQDFWDDEEWSNKVDWPDQNDVYLTNPGNLLNPQPFIDKLDNIKLPNYPARTPLPTNIAFNTRQLLDSRFDELEQHIVDALAAGGRGISQEFQDAMFNSDIERKRQALDDSLQRTEALFGGKGFRIPSSIMAAARNELIQKFQFDLENQSREIVKLIEEHLRVNWQFCIQQGISVEQVHVEFIWRYSQMFVANIDAIVKQYVADVEAYVATLNAEIAKINAEINVVMKDAELENAYQQNILQKYGHQIDLSYKEATTIVQDRANQAKAQLDGMTTMSNAYKDMHAALTQSNINVTKQSTAGTT